MPTESEEDAMVSRYIDSVGMRQGDRYEMRLEELEVILASAHRFNTTRQELLTALQRCLPTPRDDEPQLSAQRTLVSELKDALTNVIIMQTRLNGREQSLLELLKQAAEQQAIDEVRVAPEVVGRWAKAVLEARRRLG